jgi:hypothetical protein
MLVVRTKVGPTCTTKNPMEGVVTFISKETIHGSVRLNNFVREAINQIDSSEKGFIPKLKRHRGKSKNRQANFYNMPMFALSRTILLVSMWARHKMRYAYRLKKGMEFLIFTSPVSLHSNDFLIK